MFVDEQLELGMPWPAGLAKGLARSKVMVPILSRDYFTSPWCKLELALMYERWQVVAANHPSCVIIPVVIDDGDCFPPQIQALQSHPLHEFDNQYIRISSKKHIKLVDEFRNKVCPVIVKAVQNAPAFDATWETRTESEFEKEFQAHLAKLTAVPFPQMSPLK